MYKLCGTEQSALRQRRLEYGLMEAMGSMRYEDITVSGLCERLRIPRKSFYRYFSSKDGALYALIDHTLMEYESADTRRSVPKRTLRGELESFYRFWLRQKPLLDALQRSGLSGVLIERSMTYCLSDSVFPARFLPGESGDVRRQVVLFSVCGLMTMMIQWHHDGYGKDVRQMAEVAVRLLSQPLFPDAEKIL